MRSLTCVLAFASLIGINGNTCPAQQPTGPATLEGLLNSDKTQRSLATSEAEAAPSRPAGTVVRPKDGVQHPELDKAWTDYGEAVANVADSIKAVIAEKFDAATAKGDLDAAEKWQMIGEKFEKSGELPAESETKAAISAAVADYKKVREELARAYDTVVKNLTMEKKIAEAKMVRDESRAVLAKARLQAGSDRRDEGAEIKSTQLAGGPGGGEFADISPEGAVLVGVAIRSETWVDAIQPIYRLKDGQLSRGIRHGGGGGTERIFELMPDEQIQSISGYRGRFIDSLRFHTNKRVSEFYGRSRTEGGGFELALPKGAKCVGFSGRCSSYLDAIGLRYFIE